MTPRNRPTRITEVLRALEAGRAARDDGALSFGRRGEFRASVAVTAADRLRCWRLVYDVYRRKEYAAPNSSRLWYSLFDALPEAVTMMVEKDAKLIGTVTIIPDSPLGLAVDSLFPEQSSAMRLAGRRVVEVCSLAQSARSERTGIRVVGILCEMAVLVARRVMGCTDMLITVNPRHRSFYSRLMLFRQLGGTRTCERVSDAPAVCMHLDLTRVQDHVASAHRRGAKSTIYRRFMPEHRGRRVAVQIGKALRPLDEATLRKLFIEDRALLPDASRQARHYLEDCYPFYDLSPKTTDTREYLPV